MNNEQTEIVIFYIRWLANELALRDWTFTLMDTPAEDDAHGSIRPTYGRKVADIYLCSDFRDLKPEQQRHTIIHELLHCHFAQVQFLIDDLTPHMPYPTYTVFRDSFRQMQECAIDGVTDGIVEKFPLIDWGINSEAAS